MNHLPAASGIKFHYLERNDWQTIWNEQNHPYTSSPKNDAAPLKKLRSTLQVVGVEIVNSFDRISDHESRECVSAINEETTVGSIESLNNGISICQTGLKQKNEN